MKKPMVALATMWRALFITPTHLVSLVRRTNPSCNRPRMFALATVAAVLTARPLASLAGEHRQSVPGRADFAAVSTNSTSSEASWILPPPDEAPPPPPPDESRANNWVRVASASEASTSTGWVHDHIWSAHRVLELPSALPHRDRLSVTADPRDQPCPWRHPR
jgi:hypothetical protein